MPPVQSRVVFGVRTEITSLIEIPQVQGYRARLLYDNGMRSPELIAAADVTTLASILAKGTDPLLSVALFTPAGVDANFRI